MITDLLKQLKDLSLVSQRVGSAVKISEQRERVIEEAKEEAAEIAGCNAKRRGLGAETVEEFKHRILGVPGVALNLSPRPASRYRSRRHGLTTRWGDPREALAAIRKFQVLG